MAAGTSNGPQEENKRNQNMGANIDEEQMESLLSDEANQAVRDRYWSLMSMVDQHKEQHTNMNLHEIQMLLLKTNEVFEDVKRPREAAIDAELLKECGNMAKMHIQSTQSSLPVFKPRDFGEKLRTFLMDTDNDEPGKDLDLLASLGKKTTYLSQMVMGVEPFFSSMEWERPAPQTKARKKKEVSECKAQQKVKVSKGDEDMEVEAVAWMHKILKQFYIDNGKRPVCFYRFTVDPHSFTRTIENLFHLSLLIRELYVEVLEDDDGLPVVQPTQRHTGKSDENHDKQCILSIDMDEWKEIIKAFHITSAMIPPLKMPQKRKK